MIKDLPKSSGEDTVVGENVRVSGKLHTTSNIRINGRVKGEISSEGSVIIGKAAVIDGPISASDVKIEGTVNGNIIAQGQLELDSSARILGDIKTSTLSIRAGASFNGKSEMGEEKDELSKKDAKLKPKEEKKPEPELEIEN